MHQDFQGEYTIMHQAHGHMPQGRPRPKMVHMRYLLTTVVDFSSETHCTTTTGIVHERIPSFRSGIGHLDEQVCDIRQFASTGTLGGQGG